MKKRDRQYAAWVIKDDGMHIWYSGERVAFIRPSQFKYVVDDMVKHIAYEAKLHREDES